MALTNSRLITHPSVIEADGNHVVVVIDAGQADIDNIVKFCEVCNKNYDIYIYQHDSYDLEWLHFITNDVKHVLINVDSDVDIKNIDNLSTFGKDQPLLDPVSYFQKFDEAIEIL